MESKQIMHGDFLIKEISFLHIGVFNVNDMTWSDAIYFTFLVLFVYAVSTIWLDFLSIHNIFALILLAILNWNNIVNTTVILMSFLFGH